MTYTPAVDPDDATRSAPTDLATAPALNAKGPRLAPGPSHISTQKSVVVDPMVRPSPATTMFGLNEPMLNP